MDLYLTLCPETLTTIIGALMRAVGCRGLDQV